MDKYFYCRFGVVCAFVTNEYMEDGTQKLPSRLRNSINDTKMYLSNTEVVSIIEFFIPIILKGLDTN